MLRKNIADDPRIDQFVLQCVELGVEKPPEVLYHYTKLDTLFKIVKSKQTWPTHILDMKNDSKEFQHGMELFVNGLSMLEQRGLDSILSNSLKGFIQKETLDPRAAPCVLCTTSLRDDFNQWKEYGDNGAGVCIGLKSALLNQPKKVIYDDTLKSKVVRDCVEKFVVFIKELLKSGTDPNETAYVRALALAYFQITYLQSVRFKEQSWAHENEWRAIALVRQCDLKSRRGDSAEKTIRYGPVDLTYDDNFTEIILGSNCEATVESLNVILPDCPVICSSIKAL